MSGNSAAKGEQYLAQCRAMQGGQCADAGGTHNAEDVSTWSTYRARFWDRTARCAHSPVCCTSARRYGRALGSRRGIAFLAAAPERSRVSPTGIAACRDPGRRIRSWPASSGAVTRCFCPAEAVRRASVTRIPSGGFQGMSMICRPRASACISDTTDPADDEGWDTIRCVLAVVLVSNTLRRASNY